MFRLVDLWNSVVSLLVVSHCTRSVDAFGSDTRLLDLRRLRNPSLWTQPANQLNQSIDHASNRPIDRWKQSTL